MARTFLESLKQYVDFTDADSARLRALHDTALPSFKPIIDDFYEAIERHPEASAAITGGQAQIDRLKNTLVNWLDTLLLGPHDESYWEMRSRIGRVHVRISLPQAFMFTAMDRVRVRLTDIAERHYAERPEDRRATLQAIDKILDIELAIMLETYREDLTAKNRGIERLATIGHLAASIGHELRNPLGVIDSSLFLLRQHLSEDSAKTPSVVKHLDRIGSEVKRATKTIHDLLELARNRPPKRTTTYVKGVVETSVQRANLPASVVVDTNVPSDVTGLLDGDQIVQVLVNLLTNAAQAMGGSGHVFIEGREEGPKTILIVRDDGPGVPPEHRGRIFEALFTTKAKGSGLGLSLCRRIMEAHEGTIELAPSEKGATFVLSFPDGRPASPSPS